MANEFNVMRGGGVNGKEIKELFIICFEKLEWSVNNRHLYNFFMNVYLTLLETYTFN